MACPEPARLESDLAQHVTVLSLLQITLITSDIDQKNNLYRGYRPIFAHIGQYQLYLGPFNVIVTVRVKVFLTSLNSNGHGGVIWLKSYNYRVPEWSRSLSGNTGLPCPKYILVLGKKQPNLPPALLALVNRPGVVGAVLQTPPSLIDWFTDSSFVKISLKHHNSQTVRARDLIFWHEVAIPYVSCVICHMSRETCHVSCVTQLSECYAVSPNLKQHP